MNLVLFHSGELPKYIRYTLYQIRLFNKPEDLTIYFLTNSYNISNGLFNAYSVNVVDLKDYHSDKITQFEECFPHSKSEFWTITATRLFYIENFIKKEAFQDVYIFENDVLVYYEFKKLHHLFQNTYSKMAITRGGADKCMTGFMYINKVESLSLMTDFFIRLLHKYSAEAIKRSFRVGMIHEMALMFIFSTQYSDELDILPTMPFGPCQKNIEIFNSLFDPASWGQYVGGCADGIPGAKPTDHYIGQMLIDNPEYDVVWRIDSENRKIPYFSYDNAEIKINNLHIHSKKLSKYIS